MSGERDTNGMARQLLAVNEPQLALLAPLLIDRVAEELGAAPVAADRGWLTSAVETTREFLACIASNDLDRIGAPGSVFERIGVDAARRGVEFETLSSGIRVSVRLTQAQVHRAVIADDRAVDTNSVLELLARVITAGELLVTAARRGYEVAGLDQEEGEDEMARRLADELLHHGAEAAERAVAFGWAADDLVCAIVAPVDQAVRIRRESDSAVAYFAREHDVVLMHPVTKGVLATTLRPLVDGPECLVGPAVPLGEFPDSLALAQRAASVTTRGGTAAFVDDILFELACGVDPVIVRALRRKHLGHVEEASGEHGALFETLHEWLLQWGHRPSTATALGVHPQTVSGRVNRVKDLLADDLSDPRVRSELLVLLTAITTFSTRESDSVM